MALYEWSDRLATGDETIDRQHRVLISYINSLAEVIEQKNDFGILLGILLGKLITYTQTHFIYEEMLFHAHNYPDLEAHRAYHQKFTQQVNDFHQRFQAGDAQLGDEILQFLMDWLNQHILGSDLAYVEFAKKQQKPE